MPKRIAIYVDGSNFSASCNIVGLRPDFDKIVSHFSREGDVVGSYYFTALPPREVDSPIRKVTDRLQYNGWNLITKETKSFEKEGRSFMKGDMDGDMIVQAFKMCEFIDHLVLFSGDGDFRSMVEELQVRGVQVTAVSVLTRGNDNMMADELRRQVNRFVDLSELKDKISMSSVQTDKPVLKFLNNRHR